MKRIAWFLVLALAAASALSAQESETALLARAKAMLEKGNTEEAAFALRQGAQQFPRSAEVNFQLASALGRIAQNQSGSGDFTGAMSSMNEAFTALDKATEIDPGHFEAHFYYGIFAVNVPAFFGRLEPGLAHLEKAKALAERQGGGVPAEQKVVLARYLGQAYRNANRLDDAEKAWSAVLSLSASGEHAEVAQKGIEEIKKARAEARALRKTEAREGDAVSFHRAGKEAMAARKWTLAVESFRKAAEQDTTDADILILLAQALAQEAGIGYDERIHDDTNWRTNLAFEVARVMGKARSMRPGDPGIQLFYAIVCVQMPFFVGKMDEGLSILETLSKNPSLPDSIRNEAVYQLGFGYRKKGRGIWADFVKNNPDAAQAALVYGEYGLREHAIRGVQGDRVEVTFVLGFQDELEPQTAVWVEDAKGAFVKTLYVSGFSGFAKEKQVNLSEWGKSSKFETDGNTGASIDWGRYAVAWDLTDRGGRRVRPGMYKVRLEAAWWPSMRYESAETEIRVGGKASTSAVEKAPLLPRLEAKVVAKK